MSFTAVLWGVLGFLSGFLAGSAWRAGRAAPAAKSDTETPRRCWSREQWIGPVVVLLAVLMGVQYMVQVNRERDTSDCQTQWNVVFAKQLSIRSDLTTKAQDNVDRIILSIGKLVLPEGAKLSAADQRKLAAEYRKLFTDFAAESDRISDRRTATPLPPLPDCG